MKVALSFTDIQQATQEFQQQAGGDRQLSVGETVLCLSATLGQGYVRGLNLRNGLDLFIHEFELKQDLILDFTQLSTQYSLLDFTFCLSGTTLGSMPGLKSKMSVAAGQTTFTTIPDAAGTTELLAGQKILAVSLVIKPHLFLTLLENDLHKFPLDWQRRFRNAASTPYFQPSHTTPEVANILQLILHCPHQAGIRRLYLEAKALELLAICISQLTHYCSAPAPLGGIKPKDIEALHQAKTILLQNITNPPGLAELARQVGLNERKLQRGFQQLFGTTVFGVLHDYRMEQARQLLEADQMTIEAIANTIGIAHRGYFASAFKRKFGSTPRTYLKRLR
ncbi:MAG: AraC family transcriptional regulator [Cyanobacteria bacterium J06626_4]